LTDAHQTLLDLLSPEQLEVDLFRGTGQGGETPTRIFGGQVIGQALASAYATVQDRLCHSLHAYFIRPGDPQRPVSYQVDRSRDGGSFTTRRVMAIQHGKQILNMSASFHVQEDGWSHQHDAPSVPAPETLKSRAQIHVEQADKVPEALRGEFLRPRPIEIHDVDPMDLFEPEPKDDAHQTWFRMAAAEGCSDQMQHCLLAYASDMNLLGSSLRRHGLTWVGKEVMSASLDHALWFHGPAQFQNWHLYTMDSPWTGRGRGFNRGMIFDSDGQLVASVAQEGLVRRRTPKTDPSS
jgi:acyl-CoA thioesterase-2